MISNEFSYARPDSLEEAVSLLAGCDGSARVLAGGTDLIAWLRDDAIAPDLLVDIKDISGLSDIRLDGETLHIGSLVTFTDLMESEIVEERAPLLAEMAETVASRGIRNRATLIGNICSAVPSCDAGPVLLAYEATVHLVGPDGTFSVPIDEWFVGPRQTVQADAQIVTHITFPLREHGGVYVKLMRYGGEDLAQAAVSVVVDAELEYRVAFGAVAPKPLRSHRIENALRGKRLESGLVEEIVAMVADEISPITDIRASADYRTRMCEVMVKRGLEAASDRLASRGPAYGTRLI